MTQQSNRIAVVGAGNMGTGIAQKYAMHGHTVTIVDKEQNCLKKSKQMISQSLEQAVSRQIFNAEESQAILSRLNFSNDLQDIKHDELVVEAIFENLSLKQDLFKNLDQLCDKNTVLATNTSSLKVADIERGLKHPERVLGLHYFFPPAKNRLVEIITTEKTSEIAAARAKAWQLQIKKTVIHSKDSPGFIVNRFFVPWLNEAMRIVNEGRANCATVDKASQTFFQIGMGPFALMNATGLPITLHSCEALARALGDFYAPSPIIVPQIEKKSPWDLSGTIDDSLAAPIALRLLSVVAMLSCQMVFHENVCQEDDVDVGAQVGLLWKQGPFQLIRQHHPDIAKTLENMKHNAEAFFSFVKTL